jgi:hypothetical protein
MGLSLNLNLAGLQAMAAELGEAADAAARPAAQAAAEVYYQEVKKNVAALGKRTGNLANSIYQAYSADNSAPGLATYHISWNARKAPHGQLVEYGHLQRYEYYKDEQGRVRPRVRPEMMGKPRPRSNGRNRAALDAYYVTLPTPKQVPAKSFIRRAESAAPRAIQAATDVLLRHLAQGGKTA